MGVADKKPDVAMAKCPTCKGTGVNKAKLNELMASRSAYAASPTCARCHGTGNVPADSRSPLERVE